ncbi:MULTISPECIES: phenylalanine--tRNA ligase subunit beta [unclassified Rhizobium]|uniref:phenylalanine--tRNA ligase subunit beta n=1 Tax=unclassified Rhizobium TaxID=2613769 RepID=UPI001ADD2AFC|nr:MULTISPECIES: phenylalanine--tRNA ligase subunit beta [unclassified Rhizobium]MBO9096897.1 phenylalanine--tRNA ligase subunit beta [Rhizobium sp. L58/93]MBO9134262.1 phenylalanine--tRNA ligase subunit beta [Rhizobium sp. B209b/85]MBO9167136.1 phenylalanine--tRNA ligase subunit beta [Rhizobium sp. L245/93]MBO9183094.1 phenylalanine--tRNA ligase subunit beta [Rhizobium sp. E27B/91]QXZ83452.1 phenylalanine--tRNA ligase subunit beta [Rhizobium sp. K1/93]
MKFTLSWLKDHLDTEATLDEICTRLTEIGLEVDAVDDKAAFKPFVIAKVLSAEKHPQADRLKVLMVDTGADKPVQVVCGAPNARAGMIGAFAPAGTYVPGIDVTLTVGNIRGVESHGMMCSEKELQISDSHDGIIDLAEDAPVGSSYATYAGLDDAMIDVNLTPNRPDCTSIYGIARDLAASGLGTLRTRPAPVFPIEGETPVKVTLDLDDPRLCPGFALRLVRGVKNGPSPAWMQQRLMAIGLRPISALVDITNYMTFDQGRPMHVFDAAKVKGDLTVRRARDGESVLALDTREYKLSGNNVVIADDTGIESIGGIMGGEHSGCDENTTDVLIESALWDAMNIAKSGRSLGIITDARYRFERGVDPEYMLPGLERTTELVLDICGGTAAKANVVGYTPYEPKIVDFPFAEIKRLTGLEVSTTESTEILKRLGFNVSGSGERVSVAVPSWRPDVDGKADLVEEVMRIHGVDNIKPAPLESHAAVNGKILTTLQIRTRTAKRALASRGMLEAVMWSFISTDQAKLFGGGSDTLRLANPIAADMSDMRPSLLPGLLSAAQRNADKGYGDVALFEVSGTYENDRPEGQRRVAGGIRRGTATLSGAGRLWSNATKGGGKAVDVFDAKADALAVIEACGLPMGNIQIEHGGPEWYHPGRSGTIKMGPKVVLGYFGEFHPKTLEALDVSGALCGFEVFLDVMPEPKRKPTRTKPALELSPLQVVKRDFAFVVDKTVEAGAIIRAASGADRKLVTSVNVFDVFEGASLGDGKKSVAIEVQIQPAERTLTDQDFDALTQKIVANVTKTTGGVLRG